jgi:SPP1 family predicted phage head-tail adaptor
MSAGKLSERITIEQETLTGDGMGGGTSAWAAHVSLWAEVVPKSARERLQAGQVEATATHTFCIRRRADITESMRITWRGEVYNIRAIALPALRALYMEIDAERGVAQ